MTSTTPHTAQALADKLNAQASNPILRSWKRCTSIDYALHADPDPMLRADLTARREQHAHMLQMAEPEIQTLGSLVASAQSVVLLADATGVILQAAGSAAFLQKAEQVALQPGVSWAESLRGTNAIGTALFDADSVSVHGREHFLERNKILSCHAAPIFSAVGEIIGVLDISSEATTLHAYALGLAQMCARQISNRLLDHADGRLHRLVFQRQPSLLDSSERAILLVEDDRVVGANAIALQLLQADWNVLGSPVQRWLDGWKQAGVTPQAMRSCTGTPFVGTLHTGKSALPSAAKTTESIDLVAERHGSKSRIPSSKNPPLPTLASELQASLKQSLSAINAGMAILLQGETGAGKEIFARHLHAQSQWRQGPFVAINCAALPESLVEAELFGYEGGAFTGARREGSRGRLREAQGGLLFLDEIGDMPIMLQTRLLRALQEREVQPLGSDKRIPVDFGLVSATNHDLAVMVENASFRADLFYRLQDFSVHLPPLRQRHSLRDFLCQEFQRLGGRDRSMTLADTALDCLQAYPWPGNYRQLNSLLRQLIYLQPEGSLITGDELPAQLRPPDRPHLPMSDFSVPPSLLGTGPGADPYSGHTYHPPSRVDVTGSTLRDVNDLTIERVIAESNHNLSLAARSLGVHRSTLYRYLERSVAKRSGPKA